MMQYKGYLGKVEFDPDAKLLHGEVIGIRDVVTFQGRSVADVERAFRESVDDYLAFCKSRGEAPEKPYSGQLVLRIDADLHRKASMLAAAEGMSLNAWIATSLGEQVREVLSSSPKKNGKSARPSRGRSARVA
jgi:predicted HicB family RNase H-like nuclease